MPVRKVKKFAKRSALKDTKHIAVIYRNVLVVILIGIIPEIVCSSLTAMLLF